jgi:stearoyl-CoA desaturase (delta-9 desaturase)
MAIVFGIKIPTTMHNCFHNNLRSASLLIGELTSLFVLLSYGIMCINHAYHHAHADSDLDPHNPEGKTFLNFFFTSTFSGIDIIENSYLKIFGDSIETKIIFKTSIFLHLIGIPVRLIFWYVFLGKYLFIFLYLPAFSIYIFSFAHVNYVTHYTDKTGKVSILNINSNIWYKFVNFFGDGVYFHKNHHLNPGLYNPMKLEVKE